MDLIHIELPICTVADLKEQESYRIYAGSDLLIERSTHWDCYNYFVKEQIVIKKTPTILLQIETTCNNYKLTVRDFKVPEIFKIPYIKLNNDINYPKIVRAGIGRNKLFSLVNILYITV